MKKIKTYLEITIKYICSFNFWTYIFIFFIFAGVCRNLFLFSKARILNNNEIFHILLASFIIYLAQFIFILMKHHKVWLISILQIFFCLYLYQDFTFMPIVVLLRDTIYEMFPNIDYGKIYAIGFAGFSAQLTLEMLKTYMLYVYFPKPKKKIS